MPKTSKTYVEWHQFGIGHETGETRERPVDQGSVIFVVQRMFCTVRTGIASGYVRLTTEALDGPPASIDESWEDIGEVSLDSSPDIPMHATSWERDPDVELTDRLDAHGPGTYRLRVHARGRDLHWDGSTLEPVEDYLILSWLAPYAPPATLRATSLMSGGKPP